MGRTRVAKAKPKKATKAAERRATLFDRLMEIHRPALAKFEAGHKARDAEYQRFQKLRQRKDKTAFELAYAKREETRDQEKTRKKMRDYAEALSVMNDTPTPIPPYGDENSPLTKEAVSVIEETLLQKNNFKNGYGCLTLGFGCIVHKHIHGDAVVELVPIPGWPVWPQGVRTRVVRAFARECMLQLAVAFIKTHPEFSIQKEDDDGSAGYPYVLLRENNTIEFAWAYEE